MSAVVVAALLSTLLLASPVLLRAKTSDVFLNAAQQGDTEQVKKLLAGHNLELALADIGMPALVAAVEGGHTETVQVLLQSRIVSRTAPTYPQAIGAAAQKGFIEIVLLLTQNVDEKLLRGAFAVAVLSDQIDLAKVLLSNGANASMKFLVENETSRPAILGMLAANGSLEMLSLLLDWGAEVNEGNGAGETPLMAASQHGREDTIRLLLARGASIDSHDLLGQTALSLAAKNGRGEIVRTLLSLGADPNTRGKDGRTILMELASGSRTHLIQSLLASGAAIDATDPEGRTPLMIAAAAGRLDTVRMLLASKPNLEAIDKLGNTAADLARERKRADIVNEIASAATR